MDNPESRPGNERQPFESDTQKIVREHLSDPNHVISEEDFKNVRIGMTPELDETTREQIDTLQQRVDEQQKEAGGPAVTPWDVIDPDK